MQADDPRALQPIGPRTRPRRESLTDFDRYLDCFQRGLTPAFPVDERGKREWYRARDAYRGSP